MSEVIIIDLNNVTIDGVSSGSVLSTSANNKELLTDISNALEVWFNQVKSNHANTLKIQLDSHSQIIDQLKIDHAKEIESLKSVLESERAEIQKDAENKIGEVKAEHQKEFENKCKEHDEKCACMAKYSEDLKNEIESLNAKNTENSELIQALGGTVLGRKMLYEKRYSDAYLKKKAAEEEMASAQKELSLLEESN